MESGTCSILPFCGPMEDQWAFTAFKNYLSVSLRSVIKGLCDVLKATLSAHGGSKSVPQCGSWFKKSEVRDIFPMQVHFKMVSINTWIHLNCTD